MKRRLILLTLCFCMTLSLFSACRKKPLSGGELTVGVGSALTGDMGCGVWETTKADSTVQALTVGGSPVKVGRGGEYSIDGRYVKDVSEASLPDGSKTFTVHLREGVLWSDGSELTAANYVASVLFFSQEAVLAAGGSETPGKYYVGWEEFRQTGVFSGVRLIDEYSFSVTVKAEYIPYYWEYSYLDIVPVDMPLWLGEGTGISDGALGCAFSPDIGEKINTETLNAVRYASGERNTLGPYVFKGVSDSMTVLEKNPNYISENGGPYIDRLLFIETDGTFAALENGKVDAVIGVENCFEEAFRLGSGEDFNCSAYGAEELTELIYCCDIGPTAYTEVRKAVSLLCDRQTMASRMGGEGAVVPELLFGGELLAELERSLELSPVIRDVAGARALLEENGWTLNAAGERYTSGLRYRRVSAAEAEDCIDAVVLADGSILMPLRLRFACGENEGHGLFLADLSLAASEVGMEVVGVSLSETELSNRLIRNSKAGIGYGIPLYNGFITTVPVDTRGDLSVKWTQDWRNIANGRNPSYFADRALCGIAMELSFGAETPEEFSDLIKKHTLRWRETSPELPLCRSTLCDVYVSGLEGYAPDETSGFEEAILSAWIDPEKGE